LDTAALCGHLVPAGSVCAFLAGHRQRILPDELFADLFPSERGRPSVPADVVAVAMVLKELEGLSDRQAATALATDSQPAFPPRVGLDGVDDAVATQDMVAQLVAGSARSERACQPRGMWRVSAHDYDHGGKPDIAWDDKVARDALVSALVEDALAIIDALPVDGLDDAQELTGWRQAPIGRSVERRAGCRPLLTA
jgi:hypothetical protein